MFERRKGISSGVPLLPSCTYKTDDADRTCLRDNYEDSTMIVLDAVDACSLSFENEKYVHSRFDIVLVKSIPFVLGYFQLKSWTFRVIYVRWQ